MFTGLVEGVGKVKGVNRSGEDMRVTITPPFDLTDCRIGDSIAVDGVCLTVTDLSQGSFGMDVSGETLGRSTLGGLRQGAEVNLERALRLSDRLGGHLVLGHVDGVGRIIKKDPQQRSWILRISLDHGLTRYVIEKGSIAVDGISLTVNRCEDAFFEVNIIVHTGKQTSLLKKKIGERVNIETDLVGKYIEKLFSGNRSGQESSPGINLEMLIRNGFGE
ncbi:Riboflavin synthase [uncultured Desulfobacterium sp.]|uniref:Riboflavin synthase n=1 Tax=uncultured Desulfobacterium sp. TaxID=201089 RepID=A0A445N3B6_9BACT|nr:Riboflavin synthase [uncultured Desulfobacterium sp.]